MSTEKPSLTAIEREGIVSIGEAAKLRGVHPDTLKENESDKLIQISPRRWGMRRKHALMLDD